MKRILILYWALSCLYLGINAQCTDCGKLVISAGIEPPAGAEAALQVCANADIEDLSVYALISEATASPDNNDLLAGEYRFPEVAATAGTCLWIAVDEEDFTAYFGFAPDYVDDSSPVVSAPGTSNTIYLTCNSIIEDQYGTGGISSGDPERYNDGWFHRNDNSCPNGGMFDVSNWMVSGDNATDGTSSVAETGMPLSYSPNTACTVDYQTCAGVSLCDLSYSCFDDQWYANIPYSGSNSAVTLAVDINSSVTLQGDNPADTADGTIEIVIGNGSIFAISISDGTCAPVTRYGKRPTGSCAEATCLWAGQKDPGCEGSNLLIQLDPFGAGTGTMGYSIAPTDGIGTVSPGTATYGAASTFTASGHTVGAGGVAFFTITDLETGCALDVPVKDNCGGPLGCGVSVNISNVQCNDNNTPDAQDDDYITAEISASSTGGGSTFTLDYPNLEPAGPYPYNTATQVTFLLGSAGAGDIVLNATDSDDPECIGSGTVSDPGSCATVGCDLFLDSSQNCNDETGEATITTLILNGTAPYMISGDFNDSEWTGGLFSITVVPESIGSVSFTVTDANGCTATGGIAELSSCTKLDVELLDFNGGASDEGNRLHWTSASEVQFSHYMLERFSEGAFHELARIEGQAMGNGPESYSYIDRDYEPIMSYYRLAMVDEDGSITYSNTIEIDNRQEVTLTLSVSPNPGANLLSVDIQGAAEQAAMGLYSQDGKLLVSVNLPYGQGEHQFDVSSIPAGLYLLVLDNGSERISSKVIVH